MKIRDFHITGQYPTLSVETEIEETNGPSSSTRVTLGPWNYVSLLNEEELKSLVHLVYARVSASQPTKAMTALKGQSLTHVSDEELP